LLRSTKVVHHIYSEYAVEFKLVAVSNQATNQVKLNHSERSHAVHQLRQHPLFVKTNAYRENPPRHT